MWGVGREASGEGVPAVPAVSEWNFCVQYVDTDAATSPSLIYLANAGVDLLYAIEGGVDRHARTGGGECGCGWTDCGQRCVSCVCARAR